MQHWPKTTWRRVKAAAHNRPGGQKSENRNQKSELRNQKSEWEIRIEKWEIWIEKSEIRNQKPEIRNQKLEIRFHKSMSAILLRNVTPPIRPHKRKRIPSPMSGLVISSSVAAARKICRDWLEQTMVFIVDSFNCFISIVSSSSVFHQ